MDPFHHPGRDRRPRLFGEKPSGRTHDYQFSFDIDSCLDDGVNRIGTLDESDTRFDVDRPHRCNYRLHRTMAPLLKVSEGFHLGGLCLPVTGVKKRSPLVLVHSLKKGSWHLDHSHHGDPAVVAEESGADVGNSNWSKHAGRSDQDVHGSQIRTVPGKPTSQNQLVSVYARNWKEAVMTDGPQDEVINRVTWMIPNALALVGSRSGDERNAMTTSWITQLSMEPVLIGVGVDNKAVTRRLISEGRAFSVNLWSADDTRPFVKFSKPATYEDSALNGRAISEKVTGAPIFDEAIAWMDCEVRQELDLGSHTLFIGELVDAEVRDPDQRVASMSDTRMKYGGVKRGGH